MTDYVVSRHINGRDWNASTELGSQDPDLGWQVNRSTKKAVMKQVKGRGQKIADEQNTVVEIDVYSGSGDFQKTVEVTPSR